MRIVTIVSVPVNNEAGLAAWRTLTTEDGAAAAMLRLTALYGQRIIAVHFH